MNSRVTIAMVLVALPLVVWAAQMDTRVMYLEKDRAELRSELRHIQDKLDDIRARIPLVRPNL